MECWYRHRTDIEAINKDAKHGAALRHLPSASRPANAVWMWAALLACAVSSWVQELSGLLTGTQASDGTEGTTTGQRRMTLTRLRRELIDVPARLVRHAGRLLLRPPPGPNLLGRVLPALQALPGPFLSASR